MYCLVPSRLGSHSCLWAAKSSNSGCGMSGKIPRGRTYCSSESVGIEHTGLIMMTQYLDRERKQANTYLPHREQKDLWAVKPLPVLLSWYVLSKPLGSSTCTAFFSMTMLFAATHPVARLQLRQWHKWPFLLLKRSFFLMATDMLPQRHSPVIPAENADGS